jgi:hypothetical protein
MDRRTIRITDAEAFTNKRLADAMGLGVNMKSQRPDGIHGFECVGVAGNSVMERKRPQLAPVDGDHVSIIPANNPILAILPEFFPLLLERGCSAQKDFIMWHRADPPGIRCR